LTANDTMERPLADGEALLRRLEANERARERRSREFVYVVTERRIGADGIVRERGKMVRRQKGW
jgi:hypothetical protein